MMFRRSTSGSVPEAFAREVPRRRSGRFYLSLAVVLGIVGILTGVAAVAVFNESEAVVAVNRDVPYGQALLVDDLMQVRVPTGSGLASLPWSRLSEVVGRAATSSLERGQLISPGLLRGTAFPPPGMAVIEVSGREGQIPLGSLSPGDRVLIVDGSGGTGQSVDGEIVGTSGSSDQRTAEVLVRVSDAPGVARTSLSGRAVIVLVEDR